MKAENESVTVFLLSLLKPVHHKPQFIHMWKSSLQVSESFHSPMDCFHFFSEAWDNKDQGDSFTNMIQFFPQTEIQFS
jgi:hypothetical protein